MIIPIVGTAMVALISLYLAIGYHPGDLANLLNLPVPGQGSESDYNPQGTDYTPQGGDCPKTSAEAGSPCNTTMPGGATVSSVPVLEKCPCPSDTEDSGIRDTQSPGGPYRICSCR